MNTLFRSIIALSGVTLLTALAIGLGIGTETAGAEPGAVNIVAIDANNTGNTPLSIGAIDGCRDGLNVNDVITIDVVVDNIDPTDGISGTGFNLLYNGSLVNIQSRAASSAIMFMQAAPTGAYFETFSDPLPDTDGDYRHDAAELSGTPEDGVGVIAQFGVLIAGSGVATIELTDVVDPPEPDVLNFSSTKLDVLQVPGSIELHSDGSTCGVATPTPTAPPTPTPLPTEIPTDTPLASPTPTPVKTSTPAPTAAPSCNTTLAANVAVGATTITVVSSTGCAVGDTIRIGSGTSQEDVKIASVSGSTITLVAGVAKAHSAGETVVEVASVTATPGATPKTAPSTGDGSGSDGLNITLLALVAIVGVILSLVAGGSLVLARSKRED